MCVCALLVCVFVNACVCVRAQRDDDLALCGSFEGMRVCACVCVYARVCMRVCVFGCVVM